MLNSANPVGLGIMSAVGAGVAAVGNAATQRTANATNNAARHVRKASSILSMRSTNYSTSPTVPTFTTSSKLPTAIMYGSIKQMRTAGERAKAYEKAIAGLGQAESGLAEWCYNIRKQAVKTSVDLRTHATSSRAT